MQTDGMHADCGLSSHLAVHTNHTALFAQSTDVDTGQIAELAWQRGNYDRLCALSWGRNNAIMRYEPCDLGAEPAGETGACSDGRDNFQFFELLSKSVALSPFLG